MRSCIGPLSRTQTLHRHGKRSVAARKKRQWGTTTRGEGYVPLSPALTEGRCLHHEYDGRALFGSFGHVLVFLFDYTGIYHACNFLAHDDFQRNLSITILNLPIEADKVKQQQPQKANCQVGSSEEKKRNHSQGGAVANSNTTPNAAKPKNENSKTAPENQSNSAVKNNRSREIKMEHSCQTFEGKSSTRRDRTSNPVMITDALSDVRVK